MRTAPPTGGRFSGATSIRSILLTVSGGALVAEEQILRGAAWATVGALTVVEETTTCDLVLSGTTATLPSGAAATSATQSACYEAYVLLSEASAAFDAALVVGTGWTFEADQDGIETVTDARMGCTLARTGGTALDAAGEVYLAERTGWNGTVNQWGIAATGSTYATSTTDDGHGAATAAGILGSQSAAVQVDQGGGTYYSSDRAVLSNPPDRLYLTGSATGSATLADADFTAPTCRLVLLPMELP